MMMYKEDRLHVENVPLAWISFDQQACNLKQVEFYHQLYTKPEDTGQHVAPPIVQHIGGFRYRVRDGKHRLLAHIIAGRQFARCLVVEKTAERVEVVEPDRPAIANH